MKRNFTQLISQTKYNRQNLITLLTLFLLFILLLLGRQASAQRILSISPECRVAGAGSFTLSVIGDNFNNSSYITVNGAPYETERINNTLTTNIPASVTANAIVLNIRVVRSGVLTNIVPLYVLAAPQSTGVASCGPGSVTLTATGAPNGVNYKWYTASSGGEAIATGNSYTTPILTANTTYYVSMAGGICESARTAVTATINPVPSAPTTTSNSRCGSGAIQLSAAGTPDGGSYRWYISNTETTPISGANGAVYTPSLTTTTTTYYVSTVSTAGCESTSRAAVTATINPIPAAPTTTSASRCGPGTVTLTASGAQNGESYRWYTVASGGTAIAGASDASYTTPSITVTTPYYASVVSAAGCESTRTLVTATINPTPAAPTTTAASRCGPGTVNLSASGTPSGGSYRWYTTATNGTPISGVTGATYTTPSLTTTTTYYVSTVSAAGCESSTRTAVTATVNLVPDAPTVTTPAERCGSGTVSITATVDADANSARWYTASSGGTPVNTGLIYSPTLTATTTYYVSSYNTTTGCESATRTAVTATLNSIPSAPTVSGTPTPICGSGTTTLTVTGAPTGGGYQWYASATGNDPIPGATNASFTTPTISSTTTYFVAAVSPQGCESTPRTAVTATVTPVPTASITPADPVNICEGASVVLTAPLAPNGQTYTYQWLNNGGTINGQTNRTFSTNTAGTYSVIVTNTTGGANCPSQPSAAVTVTVNEIPNLVITNPAAVCSPATVDLTTTAITAGSTPDLTYTYWTNAQATTPLNNPSAVSASGTYYIKGTTLAGCSAVEAVSVTVNTPPTAVITQGATATLCQGGSVTLNAQTGTNYAYQWSLNGADIPNATGSSLLVTDAGQYTVTVTANGCSKTSGVTTVTAQGLPTATITPASPDTDLCAGESVVLNATTGAGYTYKWFRENDPTVLSTGANYTANTTGVYFVEVTNNTCSATSNRITVNVTPLPAASIIPEGPVDFCEGGHVILNAPAGAGYTYQWFLNEAPIATSTNPELRVEASGSYTVRVTANGCSNTSTPIIVKVSTQNTAAISVTPPTTFCNGGSALLTANLAPTGQPAYTYQWVLNGTNIPGATQNTYSAATGGNYTVIVSNGTCTKTSEPVTITVNPQPVATINGADQSLCVGTSNNTFTVSGTYTNGDAVWSSSNPAFVIQSQSSANGITTATVVASGAGSAVISLTVDSEVASCNPDVETITLLVKPLPVATITPSGPFEFCRGGSVTLNAPEGTGLTYQWAVGGVNIPGATGRQFSTGDAGNYTVIVTSNGCSATSAAVTVDVNELPTATITASGPLAFCAGGSVILNAPTGTGYTYQWKLNGNNIGGATANTYEATTAGSYTVVVTDGNTCSNTSAPAVVTVNPLPDATITASGLTTFCSGSTVTLTAPAAPAGRTYEYQWYKDGGIITPNGESRQYVASLEGNYTVKVTDVTAGGTGCNTTTSPPVTVTVNTTPVATIDTTTPTTFCQDGSVVLTAVANPASPATGSYTYVWRNGGTIISGATGSTYTATTSGNYTVTIINPESSGSCASVASVPVTVTVNTRPTASISAGAGNTTFCQGGSVLITATPTPASPAAPGTYSYQWYNAGTAIGGANSSTYSATASGTYYVIITNTSGNCSSAQSNSIPVTVNPIPAVPTNVAITPSTICGSGSATLSATVGANGTVVRWYETPTGGTPLSSTTVNITATKTYYASSYNASTGCESATRVAVTITVNPALANNTISAAQTICAGATPTALTGSTPTGGGGTGSYTYQWQSSSNGSTFANIPSATGQNYAPGSLTTSTWYRRIVSSSGCASSTQSISAAIQITVNPLPVVNGFSLGGDSDSDGNGVFNDVYSGQSVITLTGNPTGGVFNGPGVSGNTFSPCAALGAANERDVTIRYTITQGSVPNQCSAFIEKTVKVKRSTYRAVILANPHPFCRGVQVTYTTTIYRDLEPGDVIYPYLVNANGDPVDASGNLIATGSSSFPVPNMAYPFPPNTPEAVKNMAYRFFQPIVKPGLEAKIVDRNAATYQWGKNHEVNRKNDQYFTTDAGLSSQDYYHVYANLTQCGTLIPLQSNRMYSAELPGYSATLSVNPNMICSNGSVTLSANLNNAFDWLTANTTVEFVRSRGDVLLGSQPFTNGVYTYTLTTSGGAGGFVNGDQVYLRFITDIEKNQTITKCADNNRSNTVTINVVLVQNITGGGAFCQGGSGVPVGLAGSQSGVTYTLKRDGVTVATLAGTGNAISFGNQTVPGDYTIEGSASTGACFTTTAVRVIVTAQPLAQTLTAGNGGAYCAGGTGVPITLSNSQSGVSYQLRRTVNGTTTNVGASITGSDGQPISFGNQTVAGVYTVRATTIAVSGSVAACPVDMGNVTIQINPLPLAQTLTGGGSYCAGSSGAPIGLQSSQTGVTYNLKNSAGTIINTITGTGGAISFGNIPKGNYTVEAINTSTSCSANIAGGIQVTEIANPVAYSMTGGGAACAGGAGVPVGLNSSQSGITYQLKRTVNGVTENVTSVNGTGGAINFGNQTVAGAYTVVASTNSTPACPMPMLGEVLVTINALPLEVTAVSGSYCSNDAGAEISIPASEAGVSYQLIRLSDNANIGGAQISNSGERLTFGKQPAGTYKIVAMKTANGCSRDISVPVVVKENAITAIAGEISATVKETGQPITETNPVKLNETAVFTAPRSTYVDNSEVITYVWFVGSEVTDQWTEVQRGASNVYERKAENKDTYDVRLEILIDQALAKGCYINFLIDVVLKGVITPLPVELIYFNAERQDNNVVLTWATAMEKNNEGFEVHVSQDGKNYRQLQFVPTKNGNTSMKQTYQFVDKENGKHGTRYYRLKQLDSDGNYKFYGPAAVTFGSMSNKVLAYPNPFTKVVNLDVETDKQGAMEIVVTNLLGKQVLLKTVDVAQGKSTITLEMEGALPGSIYIVTTRLNGKTNNFKLLKQ
ncbi:T9SS type A sorting domain-containing protein [Pontibacter sp. H259]|uniref:Ig-like domain-containing protein n=1 Tax=Pontibacter sp. H259 TaxID=3133421 RepID=UPI0030C11E7D